MQLKSKTIAITGGSGAMGGLIINELIRHGGKVINIDRNEGNPACTFIKADLSNYDSIQKISAELGANRIDTLINLAGIQYFGKFALQPQDNIMLSYMVNLLAPVMLTQAVLPQMISNGSGHIVNIGSIFGSINFAYFATYSSSKAGLKGFSEAIRREVSASGVDVTYIAPRAVKTPLNSGKVMQLAEKTKMNMDSPELVVQKIIDAILKKKKDVYLGFPESLFVRVNALLPRVVDSALAKNDRIANQILEQ